MHGADIYIVVYYTVFGEPNVLEKFWNLIEYAT